MNALAVALLVLGVAVAVPALWSSRRGPWPVRIAGIAVLLAVWFATLDRSERVDETLAPDVVLVTTGASDGAGVRTIREAMAADPDARLDVVGSGGQSPATALCAAALRGGPARDVVLLWNGPFEAGAPPRAAPRFERAQALTTAPPPPFEPGAVELREFGPAFAKRPAALELRLALDGRDTWPAGADVAVTVRDAAGQPVLDEKLAGDALAKAPVVLDWQPEVAGEHRVDVIVRGGGATLRAHGVLPVTAAPPDVLVVGEPAAAATVERALSVQGVAARVASSLPDPLPPGTTVVALNALSASEQQRLLRCVEDGGGAFLVGARDGGALPVVGEPLAAASPLHRPTAGPIGPKGPSNGGSEQPAPDAPPRVEPPDRPPPDQPSTPPPKTPPDQPEAQPITGDTSAAQSSPNITTAEVQRRSIALVLVVDRSGSMAESVREGGGSKMDYAKTSAFETARQLEPEDQLGIVAFGERAYVVRPLGPPPTRADLKADIERLRAVDNNTLVADALAQAADWLEASKAPVRHAVVVTDGENFDPGDARRAQSLARQMGADGITVSVVQIATTRIGRVLDVSQIASFGKGTFVRETDGAEIPRLVFAEVRRALGAAGRRPNGETSPDSTPPAQPPAPDQKPPETPPQVADEPPPEDQPAAPEPAETPVRRLRVVALEDSRLLEPKPKGGMFPPLAGVVDGAARDGARVLLAIDDGTPLLGFANRGLGRVGAFASDLTGGWSAPWREDAEFPARLASWIEAVRPVADESASDDRLDVREIDPRGPLAAERATLAAFGFGALAPLASFVVPAPRTVSVDRRRSADDSLFAVGAIVFLAFVEWLARRHGA